MKTNSSFRGNNKKTYEKKYINIHALKLTLIEAPSDCMTAFSLLGGNSQLLIWMCALSCCLKVKFMLSSVANLKFLCQN